MKNKIQNDLVVVKVGSNTLTRQDGVDWLALDHSSFRAIGSQVLDLSQDGYSAAIVSSGAIVAGYEYGGEERTSDNSQDILEKQRLACLGQAALMRAWQDALKPRLAGQLLFSRRELNSSEGAELQAVTKRLFERGDVPIINENDALTHEEISFGDNDTLAAHFTVMLHRSGMFRESKLLLLSDVDGVYEDISDPTSVISSIHDIDAHQHLAGGAGSLNGTGGMASKFKAARIVTQNGVDMYIANGRKQNAISQVLNNQIGTHFRST